MKANPSHPQCAFLRAGLLIALLPFSAVLSSAQDQAAAPALEAEFRASRPAPRELPEAVESARVEAQVVVPGAAGGAPLTISRIPQPILPEPVAVPRVVAPFTDEQRAALRAAAPLKNLLFSPSITVYPGGVSLVSWGVKHPEKDHGEYEAWVPYDLTSVPVCGDFEVGRTRYILMGFAHPANARALARAVPAPQDLADGYRLEKGDAADADALEPLRALVTIYRDEGAQIAAKHAALQARQRAFEAWEKANPEPPRPAEIRFWRVETPAAATEAPAGTDTSTSR